MPRSVTGLGYVGLFVSFHVDSLHHLKLRPSARPRYYGADLGKRLPQA